LFDPSRIYDGLCLLLGLVLSVSYISCSRVVYHKESLTGEEYAPESRRQAAGPGLSLELQIPGNIPFLSPLRLPPVSGDGFLESALGSSTVPSAGEFTTFEPCLVLESDIEIPEEWIFI
jgi:hypothetical protein